MTKLRALTLLVALSLGGCVLPDIVHGGQVQVLSATEMIWKRTVSPPNGPGDDPPTGRKRVAQVLGACVVLPPALVLDAVLFGIECAVVPVIVPVGLLAWLLGA